MAEREDETGPRAPCGSERSAFGQCCCGCASLSIVKDWGEASPVVAHVCAFFVLTEKGCRQLTPIETGHGVCEAWSAKEVTRG